MDDEDEDEIAYTGAQPGLPVLTRDGTEIGFLEHVLEVPEEDLFEGIVVWTGGGKWLDRHIQRDLIRGEASHARKLELMRPEHLRFVDAEHVAVITTEYIRCDLDAAEASALQPPPTDSPVYHVRRETDRPIYPDNHTYGSMFGRGRGGFVPPPPPGGGGGFQINL
jgi:hypothetical protein